MVIGLILRLISSVSLPRGMQTPRMKPPNTAWMPAASMTKAQSAKSIRTIDSIVSLISPRSSTMRPSGTSNLRPMKNMNSAKLSPPIIAINATPGPPPKVASTIASTHHDTASSNAPAVSVSVPSAVFARPRSLMMRASIGKAVSAMHAPMNKVALPWLSPSVKSPGTSSRNGVINAANRKGATMPAADTPIALFAFDWKWSRRSVVPTRNMYRPTPTCAQT